MLCWLEQLKTSLSSIWHNSNASWLLFSRIFFSSPSHLEISKHLCFKIRDGWRFKTFLRQSAVNTAIQIYPSKENGRIVRCRIAHSHWSLLLIPFLALNTNKGIVISDVSLEGCLSNVILKHIFRTCSWEPCAIFQHHTQGISNFWAAQSLPGAEQCQRFHHKIIIVKQTEKMSESFESEGVATIQDGKRIKEYFQPFSWLETWIKLVPKKMEICHFDNSSHDFKTSWKEKPALAIFTIQAYRIQNLQRTPQSCLVIFVPLQVCYALEIQPRQEFYSEAVCEFDPQPSAAEKVPFVPSWWSVCAW